MAEERVQKILARAGYGSRRASEELITAGRVRVNGQVALLGSKADPQKDTITIDNQPIGREQPPVYIAMHKPQGVLSEVSPDEPRETVRDLVPVPGHLFIVGRLDMESEGLILLTNDGELANKLTHPRYGHEKEYRVLFAARPDERQLEAWRHGIVLEDGYRTAPAQIRIEAPHGKGAWARVILREGRKRQIREMGRQTGLPVFRIVRIRIGSLLLGDLKPGQWRELRPDEVRALQVNKPYRETERPKRDDRRAGSSRLARRPGGAPSDREGLRPVREGSRMGRRGTRSEEERSSGPGQEKKRFERQSSEPSEERPSTRRRTPTTRTPRDSAAGPSRSGSRPTVTRRDSDTSVNRPSGRPAPRRGNEPQPDHESTRGQRPAAPRRRTPPGSGSRGRGS